MADRDLEGRTAFVSGSGRNIGRAIVLALAGRGCNVVVNGSSDRGACEATAEAGGGCGAATLVAMGDMGNADDVARVMRATFDAFGGIDILVNNAAIRPHRPFLETSAEEWRKVIVTDLDAVFHTCRAALPHMMTRRWGRIVNFTGMNSIAGYLNGAPISAAKHGVWGLTKVLAREFGPHGITANVISPGPIRGDADPEERRRALDRQAESIPVGHAGEPQDVAALACFLCSDGARFISGQMIAANGGMTA